jgi:hypothetical protein
MASGTGLPWRETRIGALSVNFEQSPNNCMMRQVMADRNATPTPVADAFGLRNIIQDLSADLADLRAGTITVNDALARAAIAKQIWNGVRIYMAIAKPGQSDETAHPALPKGADK